MRQTEYAPEGNAPLFPAGQSPAQLEQAMLEQRILRGTAVRCDSQKDLYVRFGGWEGVMPRSEAVHPSISGSSRDISVLSIVGKEIAFTILTLETDHFGRPKPILSRRLAQQQIIDRTEQTL